MWTAAALRRLGARRFVSRCGNSSIHGYEIGPSDGEPWLLLHGLGATSIAWYPAVAALRSECRIVIPELSALGGTQCPGSGLNAREGAEVAAQLIQSRLGGSATVAGMSLGGWMGVRLALEHPVAVERLFIVNGAGYLDQDWDRIQEIVTVDSLADAARLIDALFHRAPWALRVSKRAFFAAYTSPGVRHVLATTDETHAFTDEDLGLISHPVGLLWGELDQLFQLPVAHAMHAALPQSELQIVEGCGHGVHWERPGQMVRAMDTFRRSTRRPTPPPAS